MIFVVWFEGSGVQNRGQFPPENEPAPYFRSLAGRSPCLPFFVQIRLTKYEVRVVGEDLYGE